MTNPLKVRAQGQFEDLFNFYSRIDCNDLGRRAVEGLIRAGAFDSFDADRSKLLANVSRAIQAAEGREASVNQVDLFEFDEPGAPAAPIEWSPAPQWSERQRLQEEKAALCFFLSGHLFHEHQVDVRRFLELWLADLQPSPQPVWVAGIVASQQTRMTRNGKMSVILLEDGTGSVKLPLYNDVYERHRALIRDDGLLVIQAKVIRDDYSGGVQVVAERLLDLTGAWQEFDQRLPICLNGVADANTLRAIEPYAVRAPGSQVMQVVVEYGTADAPCAVEMGENRGVRPHDDLMAAVRRRLHPQSGTFDYRG